MDKHLFSRDSHIPEEIMIGYVARTCPPARRTEVEEHCLDCESCCARLAVMLRVNFTKETEEEKRQLETLLPLGLEAASLARWQFANPEVSSSPEEKAPAPKFQPANQQSRSANITRSRKYRRDLTVSITITALLLMVGLGYWAFRAYPPAESGEIAALDLIHLERRPLEARVTGGFTYHPYERKRGEAPESKIDRDQLNYTLAELTRAIANHPSVEGHHSLGRLYLMLGNFDQAKEQLSLALADAPRHAKIHADLGALYYETSKYEDPEPLLSKAIEHYNLAIESDPQLSEAWFNRALCHQQMKQYAEAKIDWERYLMLDWNSAWAVEARSHLENLKAQP